MPLHQAAIPVAVDLPLEAGRLRESVQLEIEAFEKQLAKMAEAPDAEWLSLSLDWPSVPDTGGESGGPPPAAVEEMEKLRAENAALQQKYRDLKEQFAGVRKEFDEMLSVKQPAQTNT